MKKRIWATLLAFCLIFSCAVGWERGAEAEAMDLYQGNVVTFGSYNGQPVEWYVLAFGYSDGSDEADLAFLLAKDTLCSYRFSTQEHPMWAGSDVNRFLNDELVYQLFSEEEQAWIGTGTFSDPASPYSIPGLPGESSSGKLILLSYYEARDLLPSQQARSASQDWWLRTSRDYDEYTHYVSADGQLQEGSAIENELGVRPAMWVVMDNPTGTLQVVDDTVWNPYPEQEDDGVFGVGDYLQLGRYEQDGDTENGPPMEGAGNQRRHRHADYPLLHRHSAVSQYPQRGRELGAELPAKLAERRIYGHGLQRSGKERADSDRRGKFRHGRGHEFQ